MDILDYLRALRRRWRVILIVAVVAGTAALLTAPSAAKRDEAPVGTVYQATATLLRAPDAQTVDLPTIRLYIGTGEIPKAVAGKIGYKGAPAGLAARMQVAGDDQVGSVTISTSDPDPKTAEKIANAFADQTVAYLVALAERNNQSAMNSVDGQIAKQLKQLGRANRDAAVAVDGSVEAIALDAEKTAIQQSLVNLYARRSQLQTSSGATSPLNVLERAQAYPQLSGGPSIQAPTSRTPRVALGLLVGLLLGGAAALLIERLDTRLQGRESAENAFGLPVVAEIPHIRRAMRRWGAVVSVSAPESAAAEAYRSLRAAFLLIPSRALRETTTRTEQPGTGSVVLVTAPTNRSGKSTTAANLAACLAESGRRVLVIDGDLRNPAVAEMLGVHAAPGLTDLALMGEAGSLEKIVRRSSVAPVGVVTAGQQVTAGGVLEGSVGPILSSAREIADVVIVDAAPLLAGSDALDLMPHVDTVIMVGRMRRTTRDQAERARELLVRIGVPVLGVALVGTRSGTVAPSGHGSMWERMTGRRPAPAKVKIRDAGRHGEAGRHGSRGRGR